MRIIGHRHTGIIVNDIDRMLDFYIGLGFVLRRRDLESGEFVNHLLSSKDRTFHTAKLRLPDDRVPIPCQFNLELMKLADNQEDSLADFVFDSFDFEQRNIGVLDIAFTVDDIEAVLKYILDSGGDLISKPLQATAGFPALHSYARDPEGNVLHIAQNISG